MKFKDDYPSEASKRFDEIGDIAKQFRPNLTSDQMDEIVKGLNKMELVVLLAKIQNDMEWELWKHWQKVSPDRDWEDDIPKKPEN